MNSLLKYLFCGLLVFHSIGAQNVLQVLESYGSFSKLLELIDLAGISGILASSENITLLAPDDDAFSRLPRANIIQLYISRPFLMDTLSYHAIAETVFTDDLENELGFIALSGNELRFNIYSGDDNIYVNGVPIKLANVPASNGVIQIIEKVLLTPKQSFLQVLTDPRTSAFAEKLRTIFEYPLNRGEELTGYSLFFPSNEAVDDFPFWDNLIGSSTLFNKLISHRIIPKTLYTAALNDPLRIFRNNLAENVKTTHAAGAVENYFFEGSKIVVANITTLDGVLHIVDKFMLPDYLTVFEIATIAGTTKYPSLVQDGSMTPDISNFNSKTIFIPTNEAFQAVNNFEGLDGPTIRERLLYHLYQGIATDSQFHDRNNLLSSDTAGNILRLSEGMVNDAKVLYSFPSANGMIYIIDKVLTPLKTIRESVAADPELSEFAALLAASSFDDPIVPFTLFAPVNSEISKYGQFFLDQIKLQQNENFLNELIAYHVVTGELYPSDIPMEGSLISYYGRVIEVNQLDDQIYFNGIRTTLDEGCIRLNGALHTLEGILIPRMDFVSITNLLGLTSFQSVVLSEDILGSYDAPFTIFAPSNEAVNAYLQNPDLTAFMIHFVSGKEYLNIEFEQYSLLESVAGQRIRLSPYGGWSANAVPIVAFNVPFVGGVIHVVDSLLGFPSTFTIGTSLEDLGLSAFDSLLQFVPMDSLFDDTVPTTLFAPSDEGILALDQETIIRYLSNLPALQQLIENHMLTGLVVYSDGFDNDTRFVSDADYPLSLDGGLINSEVLVTASDILLSNGVVHIVNGLIFPHTEVPFVVILEFVSYEANRLTIRFDLQGGYLDMIKVQLFAEQAGTATKRDIFEPITTDLFGNFGVGQRTGSGLEMTWTTDLTRRYNLFLRVDNGRYETDSSVHEVRPEAVDFIPGSTACESRSPFFPNLPQYKLDRPEVTNRKRSLARRVQIETESCAF